MKFSVKINFLLIIILLFGTVLRLYKIADISLWHDEAFSALLICYPFGEMINRIILDVHPPLYYIMLRIWDIILGDSLLSLRLFSAFFGILTVYFTYLFVKTAFKNERLSLIAATFIAINPFQIQYATEARMYTLGTFLIMLSSWLLVKALEAPSFQAITINQTEKIIFTIKKYRWWILYGISAVTAIYTHYYLIFSIFGQVLFIIFWAFKNYGSKPLTINGLKIKEWINSENIKGAIIAYAISFLIFLPWISILLKQLGQVEENYWIPKMNSFSIPNTIFHLFAGTNINTENSNLIIISLVFLAFLALALKREKNNYKWLTIFSFFVPFVIAVVLSFKRSLYLDRYFVFVGLFYLVILASFIESIKKNILRNAFLIFFIAASILLFNKNWQNINSDGKFGMAGASEFLFKNAAPEDKVYINSTFIFFTYKYYAYRNFFGGGYPSNFNPSEMIQENNIFAGNRLYPEYISPLLYTPGLTKLSDIPHFSGTALLTDYDLLTDFNKNVKRGEIVWLIWTTGFGGSKPTDIPQNWTQIDETGFQDVFDYRGWIVVTKYKEQ